MSETLPNGVIFNQGKIKKNFGKKNDEILLRTCYRPFMYISKIMSRFNLSVLFCKASQQIMKSENIVCWFWWVVKRIYSTNTRVKL